MGDRRITRLALLLLVAVCLTSCAVFTGKGTAPGDLVVGRDPEQVTGSAGTVIIPGGHLVVRTGRPVTEVADDETADLRGRKGPDGGGFVPVSWTFDPAAIPDPSVATAGELKPADVSLRVGPTTYAVGSPYAVSPDGRSLTTSAHRTFYVAVPDTTLAVSVVVSYDGLDQTLDPATGTIHAGVAAPYYGRGTPPGLARCSATRWRSSRGFHVRMPCRVLGPRFLPYAAGQGWVEPGRIFATFAVDTTPYDVTWRGRRVTVATATDASTYQGAAPVSRAAAESVSSAGGSLADVLVFDATASAGQRSLVLSRRVTVESPAHGMPASFVATQRLPVRH